MGFIEMMVANKRLNTMSEAFFEKVHRLERLINTNGGVNEGDQKVFCSPSFGLPTPPQTTSATSISGISRPGAVPSGLLDQPRSSCRNYLETLQKRIIFFSLFGLYYLMIWKSVATALSANGRHGRSRLS